MHWIRLGTELTMHIGTLSVLLHHNFHEVSCCSVFHAFNLLLRMTVMSFSFSNEKFFTKRFSIIAFKRTKNINKRIVSYSMRNKTIAHIVQYFYIVLCSSVSFHWDVWMLLRFLFSLILFPCFFLFLILSLYLKHVSVLMWFTSKFVFMLINIQIEISDKQMLSLRNLLLLEWQNIKAFSGSFRCGFKLKLFINLKCCHCDIEFKFQK